MTDRDSSVAIGRNNVRTPRYVRAHMCPAPFLYASINRQSDTSGIVLLSLDSAFCAYLGPLPLLQSLSSRASRGRGNRARSLHCLYQRDHKHWPLHFKLPSDALATCICNMYIAFGGGYELTCTPTLGMYPEWPTLS